MNFHFLTDEVLSLVQCPSECPIISGNLCSSYKLQAPRAFLVDWTNTFVDQLQDQKLNEASLSIAAPAQESSSKITTVIHGTSDLCRNAVTLMHDAAKAFSAQSFKGTPFVPCSLSEILGRAPITSLEKDLIESAFGECLEYFVKGVPSQPSNFVPGFVGVSAVLEKVLQRISMLFEKKVRKVMNDHLENPHVAACVGSPTITFLKIATGKANMLNLRNLVVHGFVNSCCPSWVLFLISIVLELIEKYQHKLLELKVDPVTQVSREISRIGPSIDASFKVESCKWFNASLVQNPMASVSMFHENGTAPERLSWLLFKNAQDLLTEISSCDDLKQNVAQHPKMRSIIYCSFQLIPVLEAVIRLLFVDYNIDIVPEYYKVSEFSVFFIAMDVLIQPSVVLYGSQLVAENGNFFTKPKCAPEVAEEATKRVYENKLVSHLGGIAVLLNDIFSFQLGPRLKDFLFHGDFNVINQPVLWFYLLGAVAMSCAGFARAFYEANPALSERNAFISKNMTSVKPRDKNLCKNDCVCSLCTYHSSCHPVAIARSIAMTNIEITHRRVSSSSEISPLLELISEACRKTQVLGNAVVSPEIISPFAFPAPKCSLALLCAKALELLQRAEEDWERNEAKKNILFNDQVAVLQSVKQLIAAFTLVFACTTREFKNMQKCQKKLFCFVERLVVSLRKGRSKNVMLMLQSILGVLE